MFFSLLLLASLLLASCEKVNLDEPEGRLEPEGGVKVRFSIANLTQIPFEGDVATPPSGAALSAVCTRISFAIYQADGAVYDARHQQSTDPEFGTLTTSLPPGNYKIIVLAHSGLAVPTFESWERVKFKDNKLTDTFYCVKDIEVAGGGSYEFELKRAVSMFRLVVSDAIPPGVKRMKFYYTGGSSTFDPLSGFGCVNSRQTEYREVPADGHDAGRQFEVYTFPHAEEDELKMTVTALNADNETVAEHVFTAVPVRRNVITPYSGSFFGGTPTGGQGGGGGDVTFTLSFDTSWTTITHSY